MLSGTVEPRYSTVLYLRLFMDPEHCAAQLERRLCVFSPLVLFPTGYCIMIMEHSTQYKTVQFSTVAGTVGSRP